VLGTFEIQEKYCFHKSGLNRRLRRKCSLARAPARRCQTLKVENSECAMQQALVEGHDKMMSYYYSARATTSVLKVA
jgi:hypothetical protein